MTGTTQGPLRDVRVLDFCGFIAGSYGAMMLGDFGAEVVKVEPLHGDGCRAWGPYFKGESQLFQGWNRNKRSLAVDLRDERGRQVVYDLVPRFDVVMENFRPGITGKLGIDYETLRRHREDLIYLTSTAFGTSGPDAARPGYDPVLQTMGGAAKSNERYSGSVHICSVAVSDYQAAMLAVSGICAALYERQRSGRGQHIETSLLQAVMSVQSHFYVQALDVEAEGARGIYPYRMFETADDRLFIAAATDKFWRLLCEALEVPELGTDRRYARNSDRVPHGEDLTAILQPILLGRGAREWESLLVEKGVPCAAVRDWNEFFDHPQVTAMGMNPIVEHSTAGRMRVSGVPVDFRATPGAIQRAAPRLGEHSREVLAEIGYEESRIEELLADGVVAQP